MLKPPTTKKALPPPKQKGGTSIALTSKPRSKQPLPPLPPPTKNKQPLPPPAKKKQPLPPPAKKSKKTTKHNKAPQNRKLQMLKMNRKNRKSNPDNPDNPDNPNYPDNPNNPNNGDIELASLRPPSFKRGSRIETMNPLTNDATTVSSSKQFEHTKTTSPAKHPATLPPSPPPPPPPHVATEPFPSIGLLLSSIVLVALGCALNTIGWLFITNNQFTYHQNNTNTDQGAVLTSFSPGRWEPKLDQSCCKWAWNQRLDGAAVSRNTYDMTTYLLTYIPIGIGFLYIGLFIVGFFLTWLQRWSTNKQDKILSKMVLFFPLLAIMWTPMDSSPTCMHSLDNTSLYSMQEQQMFCGFEDAKNTQFENNSNIGSDVNTKKNASDFISNKKVSTYDMLRPMYTTTADKREKEYCVNEISSGGGSGGRGGTANQGTCEIIEIQEAKTCQMNTEDDLKWYSNPSRAGMNMTAKELNGVLDNLPIVWAMVFSNFKNSNRYEEGGIYEKCFHQMLSIMCDVFAPPCRHSDAVNNVFTATLKDVSGGKCQPSKRF